MQNAINLYLPIIDISLGFHGISANLKMQSDHARVTSQDIQQHQVRVKSCLLRPTRLHVAVRQFVKTWKCVY